MQGPAGSEAEPGLPRRVVDAVPEALVGVAADGVTCTLWNRAAEALLGWTAARGARPPAADPADGRPRPA